MLNTGTLKEIYENTMNTWIWAHRSTSMFSPLVCDLCGEEADGVLHSMAGMNGELLVCGLCYLKSIYSDGVES